MDGLLTFNNSLKSEVEVERLLDVYMAVARDQIKALVDRLTDEQAQALWVILSSMAWPEEEISPEEAREISQARAEIEAGKGVKAEEVWRELGI